MRLVDLLLAETMVLVMETFLDIVGLYILKDTEFPCRELTSCMDLLMRAKRLLGVSGLWCFLRRDLKGLAMVVGVWQKLEPRFMRVLEQGSMGESMIVSMMFLELILGKEAVYRGTGSIIFIGIHMASIPCTIALRLISLATRSTYAFCFERTCFLTFRMRFLPP